MTEPDANATFQKVLPALTDLAATTCGDERLAKLMLFEIFDGQVYPNTLADIKSERVGEAREKARQFADLFLGSHPLIRSLVLMTLDLRAMRLADNGDGEEARRIRSSWPYSNYLDQIPAIYQSATPEGYAAAASVFLAWAPSEVEYGHSLVAKMRADGKLPRAD